MVSFLFQLKESLQSFAPERSRLRIHNTGRIDTKKTVKGAHSGSSDASCKASLILQSFSKSYSRTRDEYTPRERLG